MVKKRRVKPKGRPTPVANDLMLAPMVMLMRMPLMAAEAGKSSMMGRETALAVNEKTRAMAEGALAAQMSLFQSATRFWPDVFSGRTPSMLTGAAAQRSLNAAFKPASAAVGANFRRLSGGGV